jgi:hypothetical protein
LKVSNSNRPSRHKSDKVFGTHTGVGKVSTRKRCKAGFWVGRELLLKVDFDQVDRFANGALFNFELSSRLQSETEFHPTRQQYF